jgi:hypothetical protein
LFKNVVAVPTRVPGKSDSSSYRFHACSYCSQRWWRCPRPFPAPPRVSARTSPTPSLCRRPPSASSVQEADPTPVDEARSVPRWAEGLIVTRLALTRASLDPLSGTERLTRLRRQSPRGPSSPHTKEEPIDRHPKSRFVGWEESPFPETLTVRSIRALLLVASRRCVLWTHFQIPALLLLKVAPPSTELTEIHMQICAYPPSAELGESPRVNPP